MINYAKNFREDNIPVGTDCLNSFNYKLEFQVFFYHEKNKTGQRQGTVHTGVIVYSTPYSVNIFEGKHFQKSMTN